MTATGSGTIDTTDLPPLSFAEGGFSEIVPDNALAALGTHEFGPNWQGFQTVTSGGPFGTGGESLASTEAGDAIGVDGGFILLPAGYISGSALSATNTFDGSFGSLGLTPGTYTWTWGTGAHADSLTLQIGPLDTGPVAAPEPSTAMLAASGAVAFAAYGWARRRHQRRQVLA